MYICITFNKFLLNFTMHEHSEIVYFLLSANIIPLKLASPASKFSIMSSANNIRVGNVVKVCQ